MKLLFVSNLYQPYLIGGAERIAQNLAECMVSRGHRVTVVTLSPHNAEERRQIRGVDVRFIPIRNLYHLCSRSPSKAMRLAWHILDIFNVAAGRDICRIIDEDRPDLVHTHNIAGFSSAVWWHIQRYGVPTIHTMQDYYLMCSRSTLFAGGRNCSRPCYSCRLLSLARRRLVPRLTAVVAVSKFVLDLHERALPEFRNLSRKEIIHNGVPASNGTGKASPPHCSSNIRIGYLGQLVQWKGVSRLLDDFTRLDSPNVELLIAGDGPQAFVRELRTRYDEDKRIRFLGAVRSRHFLNSIDALTVPSLWNDPCPLVVSEAIQSGVPVIGSRRGGIPELIREGVDGVLFEPTARGEFAATLLRSIENGLVSAETPHFLRWSTHHLTTEMMADKYENVYRDVI